MDAAFEHLDSISHAVSQFLGIREIADFVEAILKHRDFPYFRQGNSHSGLYTVSQMSPKFN